MKTRPSIVAVLVALIVPAIQAGTYLGNEDLTEDTFYSTFIQKRLSIGISIADTSMKELSTPHEHAYLGNLDTLKEDSMTALGLIVRYDVCDYVAIEFANDLSAELDAYNWGTPDGEHESSTDGSLKLSGYRIQLLLQYPVDLTGFIDFTDDFFVIPYFGLGFYDVSASWNHASWWHWGWASPEDYDLYANGVQAPHNKYSRWMLPEDPGMSFTFTIGLGFRMMDHLGIDIFYRHIAIDDVETDFRVNRPNGRLMRDGAFPAECNQFGATIRYVF